MKCSYELLVSLENIELTLSDIKNNKSPLTLSEYIELIEAQLEMIKQTEGIK